MTLTVNTKLFPRWAVSKLLEENIIKLKERCDECETFEVLKDIVINNKIIARVGDLIKRVFNKSVEVDNVKLYELSSIFNFTFIIASVVVLSIVYLLGELIDYLC